MNTHSWSFINIHDLQVFYIPSDAGVQPSTVSIESTTLNHEICYDDSLRSPSEARADEGTIDMFDLHVAIVRTQTSRIVQPKWKGLDNNGNCVFYWLL